MVDTGWFTSSHSGTANADCVEVRITTSVVRVRDSKNRVGPELRFRPGIWQEWLSRLDSHDNHS